LGLPERPQEEKGLVFDNDLQEISIVVEQAVTVKSGGRHD
jgi:hypothetical protein